MAIAVYGLGTSNWSSDSSDALAASKQEHLHTQSFSQTSTIAAATYYLGPMRATGTLVAFEASITEAIATGADRTVTLDFKRSTGAGAFSTVLSATVVFNNGSSLRSISNGTLSTTSLSDNDMMQVTVTVAGSAGAQATGLCIGCTWRENFA